MHTAGDLGSQRGQQNYEREAHSSNDDRLSFEPEWLRIVLCGNDVDGIVFVDAGIVAT